MPSKQIVDVPGLADSTQYAYAQCAVAGDFVFVAGQTGVDAQYGIVSPEFEPQARQALENVRLALEAAGARMQDIVTMTVHLADIRDSRKFLELRKEILGDHLAPSAVVGGNDFVLPGLLVEVQAIAVREAP